MADPRIAEFLIPTDVGVPESIALDIGPRRVKARAGGLRKLIGNINRRGERMHDKALLGDPMPVSDATAKGSAPLDKDAYLPNLRVVSLAAEGLADFFAAACRRDPNVASDWADRLVNDAHALQTYIGETVVSLISTLGLSVTTDRALPLEVTSGGRFVTEVQMELLARIPMSPLDSAAFLTQLYADLYSFVVSGGSLSGAWGKLVPKGGELQLELSSTLDQDMKDEVADLVAAGKQRGSAKVDRPT